MRRVNVNKARKAWLAQRRLDDSDDGELAAEAFAAGWNAARPAIRGTGQGASHNGATRPGELEVTLWGHTGNGRSIALTYGEDGIARLKADLDRFGL
jgi:hypothetical protein